MCQAAELPGGLRTGICREIVIVLSPPQRRVKVRRSRCPESDLTFSPRDETYSEGCRAMGEGRA